MNFNKILIYAIPVLAVFGAQAMEHQGSIVINNYNSEVDITVEQILKDNWSSLYQGKDYDREFAKQHLIRAVKPLKENRSKETERTIKVLRNNEQICGFITYYFFPEGANQGEQRGYIELLAVDEMQRRKGYAKQLMQNAIEKLQQKNPKKIEIFAAKDNEISKALYKKLGFEQVQEGQRMVKLELPMA